METETNSSQFCQKRKLPVSPIKKPEEVNDGDVNLDDIIGQLDAEIDQINKKKKVEPKDD